MRMKMELIRVWEGEKNEEKDNVTVHEFWGREIGVLRVVISRYNWYYEIYRLYQTKDETYVLIEIENVGYTTRSKIYRFDDLDDAAKGGFVNILYEMYVLDEELELWREGWANR